MNHSLGGAPFFGQSLLMCHQHLVLQVKIAPHREHACFLQFFIARCSVVMYRLGILISSYTGVICFHAQAGLLH